MRAYPQVVVNARVKNENKLEYEKNEKIEKFRKELETEFINNGRVLIRPSRNRTINQNYD